MADCTKNLGLDNEVVRLTSALMENNSIAILLYLKDCKKEISKEDIVKSFGAGSLKGVRMLEAFKFVNEKNSHVTITERGVFQAEGLLSLIE